MKGIVEKIGPGKTIFVAASGPLAAVPWAALPVGAIDGDPETVQWAIEVGNFVTMPSASSLVLTRSMPAVRAPKPILAFADPSFDGTQTAATGGRLQLFVPGWEKRAAGDDAGANAGRDADPT